MRESIELRENDLTFSVEYAAELLGAAYMLCPDQDAVCEAGLPRCNEEYRDQLLTALRPWQGSRLTQLLELFSDRYNFNYDAPVALALHLRHGLPIDREALFLHRKPIPAALFDEFLAEFSRFDQESGFAALYSGRAAYYQALLQHFMADYRQYDPLAYLTGLFPPPPRTRFHINLMAGITNSNYGVTAGDHIYANLCPDGRTRYGDMPDYSHDLIYWTTLIVHEFAHAFVNPLTAACRDIIARKDLAPYAALLRALEYGTSLETYINETVIRAIECRYVSGFFPAQHDALLGEYVQEGYDKIPQVEALLADGPGTLYPRVLDLF